jgi:hypothetical protein
MLRRRARGIGHWTRLNVADGWQVAATILLVIGVFGFWAMILQAKHVLPPTGSAFQLLQTFDTTTLTTQPTIEPSPSPTPDPSVSEAAPAPSSPRVPVSVAGPAPTRRPAPSQSARPTPTPIPTPTPTERPCLYKACPTPTPTP